MPMGCIASLKMTYVASVLLIFGAIITILAYANLYSLNGEVFDSANTSPLFIDAHSSNERSFFISIGIDQKKVGVFVDNVAGEGWINHSFEMALLNGKGDSVTITEEAAPLGGYYIFDIPSSWNSVGGARIYNPEDYAVAVSVEFIIYSQIRNPYWLTAMIAGLLLAVAGIILIILNIRRRHTVRMQHKAESTIFVTMKRNHSERREAEKKTS
jgi:ABC-type Fe3+-siderophore transport system permease subunit